MHIANLQINFMPQLQTLPNPPTNPIPRLENRDLHATPQQNIRTPQPSEPSAHNAHTNRRLFRFRHGTFEHVFRVHVLVRVAFPRVQVLEDARRAGGRAVGAVLASFHRCRLDRVWPPRGLQDIVVVHGYAVSVIDLYVYM